MQERILTPEQVAKVLQVHPFTILKFIKQGKLKASKLGRVYRIRESEVERFLDQTTNNSLKDKMSEKERKEGKVLGNVENFENLPQEETVEKTEKKTVNKHKKKSKNRTQGEVNEEKDTDEELLSSSPESSDASEVSQPQVLEQPNLDTTEMKVREVDIENGGDQHYYILE
jgi:excisionase family DNA binding protein